MSAPSTRYWLPIAIMLLGGCVGTPSGPTVLVLPSGDKPFEAFQHDEAVCRDYAAAAVAGGPQAANDAQVLSGIARTVLGAGIGAALGGGRGAVIGAAYGATSGALVGAAGAQSAQVGLQQRYDMAYVQCMYGHGNQAPGFTDVYPPPPGR